MASTETSVPIPRVSGLGASDSALLETLLKEAPIGFAFLDRELRFQRVNRTLAAIYGRAEGDCVGRTPSEILAPEDAAAHEAALRGILNGEPVIYSSHQLADTAPDAASVERHWALSWFPACGQDGAIAGMALIAVDLSDRHSAEQVLRRSEERHRSLVQASHQVIWVAAPDGSIHEDCPEWRAISGQDKDDYLEQGWFASVHPAERAQVEREWHEAVAAETAFEATFRVRIVSGDFRHYEARAVPIVRGGSDDGADDGNTEDTGSKVVEWVGANTDVTAQREAEEMRHRLTQQLSEAALRTVRLQQATSELAEALTVEQVVRVITEIGRSAVGVDRSAVALLDRERLRLRLVNPDGMPGMEGTEGMPPSEMGLDYPSVLTYTVRERKPLVAENPQMLRLILDDDEGIVDRFVENTDERAWVGLPLLAAGSPLGALRFAFTRAKDISEEDKVFLEALAGQCALAVERATLFEREHRTAEALQHSLLPEELPEFEGIRLASLYWPGSRHIQVGGDWYDAFPVPGGRLAAVLGDVMGKGIKAATGMSRVRNALRALAFNGPDPVEVLSGLDRVFDATERDEQITTLAYCVVEPSTGHGLLGNAGHLPPLLVSPEGEPRLLETEPGTPLGVPMPMPAERESHNFFLPSGNTMVLYSDGLVENRNRGLVSGLDELVTVASHAPAEVMADPQKLLEYLVEGMLAGYEQDDDVTLLAMHMPAPAE